ncbi:MAG: sigma-70 family RNA polymerase sigma factor [Eubacterium sp.]|nr:sigma-70 family RNA polymerase sigma factor [Eubacterium sp.]
MGTMENESIDKRIIALYQERKETAIEMTDRQYGSFSRTLSFRILQSHEDAEECVDDSYLKLWDTIPPTVPKSLKAYLGRIVRNMSLTLLRKKKAEKRNEDANVLLSELEDCIPADNNVEQAMDHMLLVQTMEKWLRSEKEENRKLFVLRYWYGEALEELAERFHLSPGKTADRLYRMRGRLRKYLEGEGVSV